MNITRRRRLWRIDVSVGIEPDQADLSSPFAIMGCNGGKSRNSDRMVASQDHRELISGQSIRHSICDIGARCEHLGKVLRVLAVTASRWQYYRHVAVVVNCQSQTLDMLRETQTAKAGQAHRIHAKLTACLSGPEAQRNTYDPNLLKFHAVLCVLPQLLRLKQIGRPINSILALFDKPLGELMQGKVIFGHRGLDHHRQARTGNDLDLTGL